MLCTAILTDRTTVLYMAELMEHRLENPIEKLLRGSSAGFAIALRGCTEEHAEQVSERFGEAAAGRVRLLEPCRIEHPHSAFLRKPVEANGQQAVQTALFAPVGKLTEVRLDGGDAVEYYVKKPEDFEVLRGFLRDVELVAAKAQAEPKGIVPLASLGLTPVREMESRWAGVELTAWALMAQDESAASCLRKLERQMHRRCEEAHRLGCRVGVLRDMAAEPLPETYMLHAGRHIEWMRHAGLSPFVEVSQPGQPLLAALAAADAGARIALTNPALYGADFVPPEGMRFIFDIDAREGLGDIQGEQVSAMLGACASAVLLADCFQSDEEKIFGYIEMLLGCMGK
jgi:hypothetical protein